MFKFVVLSACVLVAAASSGCELLLGCQDQMSEEGFFSGEASMTAYINDDQVMDAVCGQLSGLSSCIDSHMNACDDDAVKNEIKAVKDIVDYMCTPAGRTVVLSLANSECATSPLIESRMENMMSSCLESFSFGVQMEAMNAAFAGREPVMSDFCPFVDELETCLVQGSTNMCGADMGTFIGNIWDIASRDQFAEFGCTSTVTRRRRYVRSALPMIMKRTSLIRKLRR